MKSSCSSTSFFTRMLPRLPRPHRQQQLQVILDSLSLQPYVIIGSSVEECSNWGSFWGPVMYIYICVCIWSYIYIYKGNFAMMEKNMGTII